MKESTSIVQTDKEIDELEENIAPKTEYQYNKIVRETLGVVTGEDGKFNGNGLWKQTKHIFPTNRAPNVMALEDKKGNLITNYSAIRTLALNTITERLRKRPIHTHLKSIEKAKTRLTQMRLRIVSRWKSGPWGMKDMQIAIKSMKNNKCRDALGLINELFKPGVAGPMFSMSLLNMLNKTKDQIEIPQIMTKCFHCTYP